MPRRIDIRRAKIHRSYTIAELATLLGVHKHTIGRWIAAGLPTTDARRPLLINGSDLRAFIIARQPRKQRCRPGELYCLSCRAPKRPAADMVDYRPLAPRRGLLSGICPTCGRMIYRAAAPAKLEQIKGDLDVAIQKVELRLNETSTAFSNVDFKQDQDPCPNATRKTNA